MKLSRNSSIYDSSDAGRVFGWWVNFEDERVADLDYRAFDVSSQFWHVYLLSVLSPRFDHIGFDPDIWCDPRVMIQNRFATSFQQRGVLMAHRSHSMIALRSLSVPAELLEQALEDANDSVAQWSDPQRT